MAIFPTMEVDLYRAVMTTVPTSEEDLYRVVVTNVPGTEVDLYCSNAHCYRDRGSFYTGQ